jgi:uncharacterized protein
MKKVIQLPFLEKVKASLKKDDPLIQVIIGPRQVGKTTGIKLLMESWGKENIPCKYVSADGDILFPNSWILEQWELARIESNSSILIIDEIQKVERWPEIIKKLWDEKKSQIKLVLLGSSSLSIQKGLKESLAGRFELHRVYHWNYLESQKAYGIDLESYLIFGGYPGSYQFISERDTWLNYLKESIINPVIGKDILQQARVKSPALFKQCFDIICSYPAQEISYTKLLGQLQDKGNTDLIKYYLELFEEAFLIKQVFKYTNKKVLTRSSSPKILPGCPALYSVGLDAQLNSEERGRSFELMIGAQLMRLPGELFYWREGNFEVDFIYKYGKKLYGLEVKSGRKKKQGGLEKFKSNFPTAEILIVTPENFLKVFESIIPIYL